MVAFMEEGGVEARNRGSCREESLQTHFKTIAFGQGLLLHHYLLSHRTPKSPTERRALVRDYNVCSAAPAVDLSREEVMPMG